MSDKQQTNLQRVWSYVLFCLLADAVDAGEAVPVTRPLGLRVNAVESAARLSDVRRLEGLMRAHTLMALTEERSSPKHQHYLLMALSFTLHIWKVPALHASRVFLSQKSCKPCLFNAGILSNGTGSDEGHVEESVSGWSACDPLQERERATG